jgi:hypothetical protein
MQQAYSRMDTAVRCDHFTAIVGVFSSYKSNFSAPTNCRFDKTALVPNYDMSWLMLNFVITVMNVGFHNKEFPCADGRFYTMEL